MTLSDSSPKLPRNHEKNEKNFLIELRMRIVGFQFAPGLPFSSSRTEVRRLEGRFSRVVPREVVGQDLNPENFIS